MKRSNAITLMFTIFVSMVMSETQAGGLPVSGAPSCSTGTTRPLHLEDDIGNSSKYIACTCGEKVIVRRASIGGSSSLKKHCEENKATTNYVDPSSKPVFVLNVDENLDSKKALALEEEATTAYQRQIDASKAKKAEYITNQEELKKNYNNGDDLYNNETYVGELNSYQQGRMTGLKKDITELGQKKDQYVTSFGKKSPEGKSALYTQDGNGNWIVNPDLGGVGSSNTNLGGWTEDQIKEAHDEIKDYNKVVKNLDRKKASANELVFNDQNKDINKDIKKVEGEVESYEDALAKTNGNFAEAFGLYHRDTHVKYQSLCVAHRDAERKKEGKTNTPTNELGFPAESETEPVIQKVQDQNVKSCEQWAKYQTDNNPEIKETEKIVVDEIDKKENSTTDDDGNEVTEADEAKAAQYFTDRYDQSNIKVQFCGDDVYTKSYKETFLSEGHSYAADRSVENYEAMSYRENRSIKIPMECAERQRDVFDYPEMEFYTNFDNEPMKKVSITRRRRICAGLAYAQKDNLEHAYFQSAQEGSGAVSCNTYLETAKSCSEEEAGLVIGSDKTLPGKLSMTTPFVFSADRTLADGQNQNVKFESEKNCKEFMWNRFNKCMGFKFEGVHHAEKISTSDDGKTKTTYIAVYSENKDAMAKEGFTIEPGKADYTKAKEAMIAETSNQLWTCIAFRELSMEQAEINGDSWVEDEKMASLDGRFVCQRTHPWTQDYKACKQLVNTHSGFQVGDQARGIAGQGWSALNQRKIQDETMEASQASSSNALEAARNGEQYDSKGDQVNMALDAQKKSYEHQKQKEQMNLGFHSANAGTLSVMLAAFPTPNKLAAQCSDGESETDAYCLAKDALRQSDRIRKQLFPNQDVKKQMWGQVMQSSASAVLAALKAAQFKKMAGDVGKFKSAFNGLNKDAKKTESEFEVGYCALNPTAPGCQNRGPRVQGNSQFSYGSVGGQGNGGGQYGFDQDSDMGDFDEGEGLTASQQGAIDDLGNVMDQDSAGSFDNSFKKVGQGAFNRSHRGSGGGGGGGGGAASGGAYQGGSGGGAGGGANSAFGGSKQKVSYGAGSGKTKYGAGRGSNKKKSGNPFSNLFGKKKGRNVASQVTNDIAPSHSGLFDKISKRYSKMQKANRLHKLK